MKSQHAAGNLEEFSSARIDFMKESLEEAFYKLSEEDQAEIIAIGDKFTAAIKAKHPTSRQFGHLSRLELIAKLGLWLGDHENKVAD